MVCLDVIQRLMFGKRISIVALLLSLALSVAAQQYKVSGVVVDEDGKPLGYASVAVEQPPVGTYSGNDGSFTLKIPSGKHTIAVGYVGFRTEKRELNVTADVDTIVFILKAESLRMKDVVVTARQVESKEGTSSYRINDQAIKQIQAMNLQDVLSLLPGKQMSSSNYNTVQQADIRSAVSTSYNNIGTSVIVNGMAMSNDANMQVSNPAMSQTATYSSAGKGLDLRNISAAGIESVEVVTGVASAKYGNLASGAIIVKNKVGSMPLTISGNVSSTSYQGSVSKGFNVGRDGGVMNTDFSYTYSKESPIQRKNYYQNINFGLRWMKKLSEKLEWNNTVAFQTYMGFNGQRHEPEEKVANSTKVNSQNFSLNVYGSMSLGKAGDLDYSINGSLDNQYSRYMSYGTGPLPLIEALQTGTYTTTYSLIAFKQISEMRGLPVNGAADVSLSKTFTADSWTFSLTTGLQGSIDKNFGKGRAVSGGVAESAGGIGARSAAFHNVPASKTWSAYHESNIRNKADWAETKLKLGVRYDYMLERYHLVSPRLSGTLKFFDKLSARLAWGLAYKAPSMMQLYPDPAYFDYTNLSYYATEPAERLAIVTTYVYSPHNSHLRPSHTNTVEGGLDWESNWLNVRLTAYHKRLADGIALSPELLLLEKVNYKVVEKPAGKQPVVEPDGTTSILAREKYVMKNTITEVTDGIELSLIPARIEKTHTEFSFQASYMRTRQMDAGYDMQLSKYTIADSKSRYGVYEHTEFITRYSSGRLTITQQIPSLRLIFTVNADLNFVNYQEPKVGSLYPYAYYDGQGNYHEIPESERTSDEYADLKLPASTYKITDKRPFYPDFHLQVRKETRAGHSFSLYVNNFLWYNPTYEYKSRRSTLNETICFGFGMSFIIGNNK